VQLGRLSQEGQLRLRGRLGPKKAVCAVAASLLAAVYHMMKDGTQHQDLVDSANRRSNPGNRAGGPAAVR
jgi:hypothetical protein